MQPVGAEDDDQHDARAALQRRYKIFGLIGLGLLVAALVLVKLLTASQDAPRAPMPQTVTVIVPGRDMVETVISATGTLAARREMPVGIAGEGGMIARVLVEPGDWVVAGQILATIERSVQEQQARQLRASIALAQAELDRALSLQSRGFVSKADIDRKTATRDIARAQYGEIIARIGRLDIRAPAAGLVLERKAEPGQVVSPGSGTLFRLAKSGEIELLARLAESDLIRLSVGNRASVTPVGSDRSFNGEVWQVAPVIDPQTRQGIARIALSYDPQLRPGGFAAARLVAGMAALPLVPESAVQGDEQASFVYIIDADNKAQRRAIKIGAVTDRGIAVTEGLNGTEQVVVLAGAFLNPGEKVLPVRAKAEGGAK